MPLAALLLLAGLAQDSPPAAQAAAKPRHSAAPAAAAAPTDAPSAIAAGQAAFKKRHFKAAQADFEKALAADPQSAAAAFYLGYTHYKLGEPSRRMNENKEQAKELFAKAFTLDPAFRPDWGRPAPAAVAEPAAPAPALGPRTKKS
jgi:tetratricopeptide (TPR) repeat protein